MEILEILRRWMWIFLRVETEWGELAACLSTFAIKVLTCPKVRNNLGPAPDDILLGDLSNKIDED